MDPWTAAVTAGDCRPGVELRALEGSIVSDDMSALNRILQTAKQERDLALEALKRARHFKTQREEAIYTAELRVWEEVVKLCEYEHRRGGGTDGHCS